MLSHRSLACLLIIALLGVAGCTPHSDPMKDWKVLGAFNNTVVPEAIKQDAQAYFQTLPAKEGKEANYDYNLVYYEDGTGQHAVVLSAPHDGESWHYAVIYDRDNRRIKVFKYSIGMSGITDVSKCLSIRLART